LALAVARLNQITPTLQLVGLQALERLQATSACKRRVTLAEYRPALPEQGVAPPVLGVWGGEETRECASS
jgi:hypothetical protein